MSTSVGMPEPMKNSSAVKRRIFKSQMPKFETPVLAIAEHSDPGDESSIVVAQIAFINAQEQDAIVFGNKFRRLADELEIVIVVPDDGNQAARLFALHQPVFVLQVHTFRANSFAIA